MMRSKFTALLLATVLSMTAVHAQGSSSWPRYTFGRMFSIAVPMSLELRDPDSAVGKYMDDGRKNFTIIMGFPEKGTSTVFWPGICSKYARVMVNITPQDGLTQKDMAEITQDDMRYLGDIWKAQNIEQGKRASYEVSWLGAWKVICGGKHAFHIAYRRTGIDGPVRVDQYKIYDLGKEMTFIISYRVSEASYWKTDLDEVIKTLRFGE